MNSSKQSCDIIEIPFINPINFNLSKINELIHILNSVKPTKIVYCLRGDFNSQLGLLKELKKYLKPIDGQLYFCSTGNVFDGDTTIPHFKNHVPVAESDYGKFKIECERILKEGLGNNSTILRLPMIWEKNLLRLNSLVILLTKTTQYRHLIDTYKS